jgi:hypothetical protein
MVLTTQPADGLWTAQLKNNARQGRSLMAAFFESADGTPGNGTRSGVIVTTGFILASDLLAYNVAGLNVDIAPGTGVAHSPGQGPMVGFLNAVKTVRCADPPASNPRNDIIIMRMYNLAAGDVSPDGQPCRIEIVTGTPNAVPVDPVTTVANGTITAIPAQAGLGTGGVAIPLARAQVSTGGVITLTDIRKSTGVVGGPRYTLPGDAGDVGGRTGQLRYNPATDILEVKDSTATWQRMFFGDSAPRGTLGTPTSLSSTAGLTTTDTIQPEKNTVNIVTGRRYRVYHSREEANAGVANNRFNKYRVAAGATVTVAATQYDETMVAGLTGGYNTFQCFTEYLATFTGQATFGLSSSVNTSTALVSGRNRVLRVEDIGK